MNIFIENQINDKNLIEKSLKILYNEKDLKFTKDINTNTDLIYTKEDISLFSSFKHRIINHLMDSQKLLLNLPIPEDNKLSFTLYFYLDEELNVYLSTFGYTYIENKDDIDFPYEFINLHQYNIFLRKEYNRLFWNEIYTKWYRLIYNHIFSNMEYSKKNKLLKRYELFEVHFSLNEKFESQIYKIENNPTLDIEKKFKIDYNQFRNELISLYKEMFDNLINNNITKNNYVKSYIWLKINKKFTYLIDPQPSGHLITKILLKEPRTKYFTSGLNKDKRNEKKAYLEIYDIVNTGNWNFLWQSNDSVKSDNKIKKYIVNLPNNQWNFQMVNHLPNTKTLIEKANLTETLNKYTGEKYKSFYPETHIFVFGDKKKEQDAKLTNLLIEIKKSDELWIVKSSNKRCGQNILVFDKNLIPLGNYIAQNSDEGEKFVIQKYISSPLLYQERKFDLRVMVLAFYDNPEIKVYLHPKIVMRTNSVKYRKKLYYDWDKDKFIHLTNHSIQKYHPNFNEYEEGNLLPFIPETFENSMENSNKFITDTILRFGEIVKDIFESNKGTLDFINSKQFDSKDLSIHKSNQYRKYFELYGFDFIIDDKLNPWLLEININPMLEWGTKWVDEIFEEMLDDAFKITVDPVFGIGKEYKAKDYQKNDWIEILNTRM